jgi:hypothetical protein
LDKGFVEFFKKFMGGSQKDYRKLGLWLGTSVQVGWYVWFIYGLVGVGWGSGVGSRPCFKPRHVILKVSEGETLETFLNLTGEAT